jgi:hypothetical protein
VQEKADSLGAAAPAELGGEWDQMIVMDPDRVFGLEVREQGIGKL